MAFKIGRFVSRNGELHWKSYREDDDKFRANMTTDGPENSRYSKSNVSKAMVNSVARKDLSVVTPSVGYRSRIRSTLLSMDDRSRVHSFHMANPNPQPKPRNYLGVREVGYK